MHADGQLTRYGHLRKDSVAVSIGDTVLCNQTIGEVGSSGHSTGPHLHFEVRRYRGTQRYGETASAEVFVDPFFGSCSHERATESLWTNQNGYKVAPSTTCDDSTHPCKPRGSLKCNSSVELSNDMSGSTNSHFYYGCKTTGSTWSGPEVTHVSFFLFFFFSFLSLFFFCSPHPSFVPVPCLPNTPLLYYHLAKYLPMHLCIFLLCCFLLAFGLLFQPDVQDQGHSECDPLSLWKHRRCRPLPTRQSRLHGPRLLGFIHERGRF